MPTPEFTFVDWDGIPAVLTPSTAYAVLSENGSWTEVNLLEVADSGRSMSLSAFSSKFPSVDLNTIPASIEPAPSKV
jgi:hypothetical protein